MILASLVLSFSFATPLGAVFPPQVATLRLPDRGGHQLDVPRIAPEAIWLNLIPTAGAKNKNIAMGITFTWGRRGH